MNPQSEAARIRRAIGDRLAIEHGETERATLLWVIGVIDALQDRPQSSGIAPVNFGAN